MSSLNGSSKSCRSSKRGDMSRNSRNGNFASRSRTGRPSAGPNYGGGGGSGSNCTCNNIGQDFAPPSSFMPPRPGRGMDNNGMAWITNDLGISNIMAMSKTGQLNRRPPQAKPPPDDRDDERFLIKNAPIDEAEPDPAINEKQKVSLMEWFDKNVERELQKRRAQVVDDAYEPPEEGLVKKGLPVTDEFMDRMGQAGAGGIQIETKMRFEPDTELTEAAEKLAMAEAMIEFAGAVKAAEAAVEQAPPDKAEEAAVQGVREFSLFTAGKKKEEKEEANKPVEILGYIGITRPNE